MKITKTQLKQIIKEELKEATLKNEALVTDNTELTLEVAQKWLQKLEGALDSAGFSEDEVRVIGWLTRGVVLENQRVNLDPRSLQKIHQIIANGDKQ